MHVHFLFLWVCRLLGPPMMQLRHLHNKITLSQHLNSCPASIRCWNCTLFCSCAPASLRWGRKPQHSSCFGTANPKSHCKTDSHRHGPQRLRLMRLVVDHSWSTEAAYPPMYRLKWNFRLHNENGWMGYLPACLPLYSKLSKRSSLHKFSNAESDRTPARTGVTSPRPSQ